MQKFARKALAGDAVIFQKHDFIASIQKRGDAIFPDSLVPATAVRAAPSPRMTPASCFSASKVATGSEVFPAGPDEPDDETFVGASYREMEVLAHDMQFANPNLSMQQCFSRVYIVPEKSRTA